MIMRHGLSMRTSTGTGTGEQAHTRTRVRERCRVGCICVRPVPYSILFALVLCCLPWDCLRRSFLLSSVCLPSYISLSCATLLISRSFIIHPSSELHCSVSSFTRFLFLKTLSDTLFPIIYNLLCQLFVLDCSESFARPSSIVTTQRVSLVSPPDGLVRSFSLLQVYTFGPLQPWARSLIHSSPSRSIS